MPDAGPDSPRVLHVITGLGLGGAEMMLYKLVAATPDAASRCSVVTLTDDVPLGGDIRRLGVPVTALGLGSPIGIPAALVELGRTIRRARPDVVHSWMWHADLVAGLVARAARTGSAVVWSIRQSNFDPQASKRSTQVVARVNAVLSRWVPDAIVANSSAATAVHAGIGFSADCIEVIPNGFDLTRFTPDGTARRAVREELSLPDSAAVVGYVARSDPQKDHDAFFSAATEVVRRVPSAHFILCGTGVEWANPAFAAAVQSHGLKERVRLLGPRRDVERIFNAGDVAVSASAYAEGFPNTVGEAMACGVPCVVTDVGDSALVVGDTGVVVPPRDPAALADGIVRLLRLPPDEAALLRLACRRRIATQFSIEAVAHRYEDLYRRVAAARRAGSVAAR